MGNYYFTTLHRIVLHFATVSRLSLNVDKLIRRVSCLERNRTKKMKKNLRTVLTLFVLCLAVRGITSCSKDDDNEPIVYHETSVQGKVNDAVVSFSGINAKDFSDRSTTRFIVPLGEKEVSDFSWEVKLVDNPDSVVTLFLYVHNIKRDNIMIYSPNNGGEIQTDDTCYLEVKNKKTGHTDIYHPKDHSPVSAKWTYFVVTADAKFEKRRGVTITRDGYDWPGIEGFMDGTLHDDSTPARKITLHLDFKLY